MANRRPSIEQIVYTSGRRAGRSVGRLRPGAVVRVVGADFGESADDCVVLFDEVEVRPYEHGFSPTSMLVEVPLPPESTSVVCIRRGASTSEPIECRVIRPGPLRRPPGSEIKDYYRELAELATTTAMVVEAFAATTPFSVELRRGISMLNGYKHVLHRTAEMIDRFAAVQESAELPEGFEMLRSIREIDEGLRAADAAGELASLRREMYGPRGSVSGAFERAGVQFTSISERGVIDELASDVVSGLAGLFGFTVHEASKLLEGVEDFADIFQPSAETGVVVAGIDVTFDVGGPVSSVAKIFDFFGQWMQKAGDDQDAADLIRRIDGQEVKLDAAAGALENLRRQLDGHRDTTDRVDRVVADRQHGDRPTGAQGRPRRRGSSTRSARNSPPPRPNVPRSSSCSVWSPASSRESRPNSPGRRSSSTCSSPRLRRPRRSSTDTRRSSTPSTRRRTVPMASSTVRRRSSTVRRRSSTQARRNWIRWRPRPTDPRRKLDVAGQQLDADEVKLDRHEAKLDALTATLGGVDDKVDRLEAKADVTASKIDDLDEDLDRIEAKEDRADGKLDRQEAKLDALEAKADRADDKLDRQEVKLDRADDKLDRQEVKLESIETKVDRQEVKLESIETKVDRVEGKVDRVEGKVDRQEVKLDSLEAKADRAEQKLDRHEVKLDRLARPIPAEGSIASQSGGSVNVSAAVTATDVARDTVSVRAAIDVDPARLDDAGAWNDWVDFGRPNGADAIVETSVEVEYRDGSDDVVVGLLTVRDARGRVFHRGLEARPDEALDDPDEWSDWQSFLDRPA